MAVVRFFAVRIHAKKSYLIGDHDHSNRIIPNSLSGFLPWDCTADGSLHPIFREINFSCIGDIIKGWQQAGYILVKISLQEVHKKMLRLN
jgi:hypothetical protein